MEDLIKNQLDSSFSFWNCKFVADKCNKREQHKARNKQKKNHFPVYKPSERSYCCTIHRSIE